MIARRSFAISAVVVPLVAVGLIGPAVLAHGAPEDSLYASPKGDGTSCAIHHPCAIETAFSHVAAGRTIYLGPGTYKGVTTTLSDNGKSILVTGEEGKARPVIESSALTGISLTGNGSQVEDLELDFSSEHAYGIIGYPTTDINHVIVQSTSDGPAGTTACVADGELSDSLCVGGTGIETVVPSTYGMHSMTAELSGDTAIGVTIAGEGLEALLGDTALNPTNLKVEVTNSILQGGDKDIVVANDASDASTTLNVNVAYSDFATAEQLAGQGGDEAINRDSTDISAVPQFLDAAKGEYREAKGSPTIDAGTTHDVGGSDTDVQGVPRDLGGGPDMGAYEYTPLPKLSGLEVITTVMHGADLRVKVEPGQFATDVRMYATHGSDTEKTRIETVKKTKQSQLVHLDFNDLKPGTKYQVYATASSTAGNAKTADITMKTKK